jgi:hypothetical protein
MFSSKTVFPRPFPKAVTIRINKVILSRVLYAFEELSANSEDPEKFALKNGEDKIDVSKNLVHYREASLNNSAVLTG